MSQAFGKTDASVELTLGEPSWEVGESVPEQGSWSESRYLDLSTNRRIEFTKGYVEFLPVPTILHQRIGAFFYRLLYAFVEAQGLGEVLYSGLRVRLWESVIREPDVGVMLAEHASRVTEKYWDGADLLVEVVSPTDDDRKRDLVQKRSEYAQAGIPEYWIVDQELERITVLSLEGSTYAVHGEFGRGQQATSRLLQGFSVDVSKALDGGRSV
jgi:Uma2 family endonuclease